MDYEIIKISDLPESADYGNLFTIGTITDDSGNPVSKKVSLVALAEVENKVDKIPGKGLSKNDYTDEEKEKVSQIPANHRVIISDTKTWTQAADQGWSYTRSNPVEGVITDFAFNLLTGGYGFEFDSTTKYFKLNGLTDITYKEAIDIFVTGKTKQTACEHYGNWRFRTNLAGLRGGANNTFDCTRLFQDTRAEVVTVAQQSTLSGMLWFGASPRLKTVLTPVKLTFSDAYGRQSSFNGAYSLEDIQILGLRDSIGMAQCSRLSVASVLYMIENEAATSAITITLHATAYARAMADEDVQAALQEHTNVSLASE